MTDSSQYKYKVWFDSDSGIGKMNVSGIIDQGAAEGMIKEGLKVIKAEGDEVNWLVNIEKGTQPIMSPETRKVMSDTIKLISVGKIAIVGVSTIIRVVTTFIITAAGTKNVKFFKSEEEAFNWLKE